jgi:hypothetical protein
MNKLTQQRECGYCHKIYTWVWQGQLYKDGSKIYLDSKGKRWAGKRCPQCERKRVQVALKYNSFAKKIVLDELLKNNFSIKSKDYPFKAEKDGQEYVVGIQFAHAHKGKITLEEQAANSTPVDLVALVFKNVRLLPQNKINLLECGIFPAE